MVLLFCWSCRILQRYISGPKYSQTVQHQVVSFEMDGIYSNKQFSIVPLFYSLENKSSKNPFALHLKQKKATIQYFVPSLDENKFRRPSVQRSPPQSEHSFYCIDFKSEQRARPQVYCREQDGQIQKDTRTKSIFEKMQIKISFFFVQKETFVGRKVTKHALKTIEHKQLCLSSLLSETTTYEFLVLS